MVESIQTFCMGLNPHQEKGFIISEVPTTILTCQFFEDKHQLIIKKTLTNQKGDAINLDGNDITHRLPIDPKPAVMVNEPEVPITSSGIRPRPKIDSQLEKFCPSAEPRSLLRVVL